MMHRTCLGLSLLLAAQIASAEEEGVKPGPFAAATRLIQEQVESGLVGAAALLVARNGKIEVEQGFGSLSRKAGSQALQERQHFPRRFNFKAGHGDGCYDAWWIRSESAWTIRPKSICRSLRAKDASASRFETY